MSAGWFHEAGEPVNDGEREVLRRLRDELDESWAVVGNFEYLAPGNRWYECDALAVHQSGYGYLIETKAWVGEIRGNDRSWLLPAMDGGRLAARQPPIHVLTTKQKKLASVLTGQVPLANGFRLDPLVVLVSESRPILEGKSASTTVLHTELIEFLDRDPRTQQQQESANISDQAAEAIFDFLTVATRPVDGRVIGNYALNELLELRTDGVEVWDASPSADATRRCILKRYPVDLLAPTEQREEQLRLARQHHKVLDELDDADIVPLWGAPFEADGEYIVVSLMPPGRSLQSLLDTEPPDSATVDELVLEVLRVLTRIHERGVTHRWIRPASIWITPDYRVKFTDFEIGRTTGGDGVTQIVEADQFDHEFIAPEVLGDLEKASKASDLYSVAAIFREAYGANFDSASPAIADVLQRCLQSAPSGRPSDAGEALRAIQQPGAAVERFEPQDVIDDRYMVRSRDESGGLTIVYRFFDTDIKRDFSAKFVRPQYKHILDASSEWTLLEKVPSHRNIAKPTYVQRMSKVKRDHSYYTLNEAFLLTPWIEGRSLASYLDQNLPAKRILEIGRDLASGLDHLHRHDILHRDVKPENVLIREDQTAVLIDFNVSAPNSMSTTTSLGTEPYRAPEIPSDGWSQAADLYSLAVCLTELLAARRLGADAADWLHEDTELSDDLRQLLLSMLDPAATQRGSAEQLAEQLERLIADFRLRPAPTADPPVLAVAGVGNPYIERIMAYFSQSSISNAGTRGLDAFGAWLYVPTEIDRRLKPKVLSGSPSLVIITGNAGDGKTAFIRNLEDELLRSGAIRSMARSSNGSQILGNGHTWVTNWDGSQDENGSDNHSVLVEFFAGFSGQGPGPTPGRTAVIAINEGRLVDFFESAGERFAGLASIVHDTVAGHIEPPPWMVLVNLNRRVLTGRGDHDVVSQMLSRFADERLWEDCEVCPARNECPNNANATVLRHPVLGQRVSDRVREVLDVVRLRRRLHITTRDLLSALAYLVVGNASCEDIIERVEAGDRQFLLEGQAYNRLFNGRPEAGNGAGNDRLLAQLADLDPADAPRPALDGRLWLLGTETLPVHEPEPDSIDRSAIDELRQGSESERMVAHKALRRKTFFEREQPDYLDLLPYLNLARFQDAIEAAEGLANLLPEMARAISASEGLRREEPEIAVRLVDDADALDRSYVCRPASDFVLQVVDESSTAKYVEYAPDLLRIESRHDKTLALDIDIDIFEALCRMGSGFTPSREDLRGSWLSLATFKERLAALPSKELLLQARSGELTVISVDPQGAIVAESAR